MAWLSRRAGSRVGQRRSGILLPVARPSQTGRQLIERAARLSMGRAGWKPRAAGWFTRRVADGFLASVGIGIASKHHRAGEAEATAYVGLRVEAIERATSELCGFPDRGYEQRTAVSPIGYLMPENRWRAWLVNSATAEAVAEQLAEAVMDYGLPYCEKLAANPAEIVEALRHSATGVGPPGECRQALALIGLGRFEEALAFVASCEEEVQGKEGQWAEQERSWLAAFKRWWAAQNKAEDR